MEVIKFGAKTKGVKSFCFKSLNDFGLTVRCSNSRRIYTFNNVSVIEWAYPSSVSLISKYHNYLETPYDLSMWDKVEIFKAKDEQKALLNIEKLKTP